MVIRALQLGQTSAMATVTADGAGHQTTQPSGAPQTQNADASDFKQTPSY